MIRSSRSRTASIAAAQPARLSSQARLALLTGGVMLASISISSLGLLAARADEKSDRKSRQYNIGAGVLAGAAIYYGVKKRNPIAATAAGAGAYYAYRKGKQTQEEGQRGGRGRNNPRPNRGAAADNYPDDNYNSRPNSYPATTPDGYGYDRGNRGNESYPVGDYDYDNRDDSYPRDVSADDYGVVPDGGDYAQNSDSYPNYGLNGLRSQHGNSLKNSGSKGVAQNSRRIVTK